MKVRQSTSVKLTGVGMAFLGILLLSLIAAINNTNSLALLMASLLIGIFFVALIKGALNVLPLKLTHLEFDNVFAGERIPVRGILKSRFRVPDAALDVLVKSSAQSERCTLRRLGSTSELALKLSPHKRGRLRLESVNVVSSYPIGLLNWSITFDQFEHAVSTGFIYPAPVDYMVLPEYSPPGLRAAVKGDFDELQSWQNGDSLSGICWKTYARTGKRMRKQFLDSDADSLSMSLSATDDERCLDEESLTALSDEQRRSQLCYWVVDSHRRYEPYGLRFRGQRIEIASGSRHFYRCLEALTIG